MKITINIATDNAAFEDYGRETEINSIICKTAALIAGAGQREGNLRDSNGNLVGNFKVTGR